jgi:hypothetical protein
MKSSNDVSMTTARFASSRAEWRDGKCYSKYALHFLQDAPFVIDYRDMKRQLIKPKMKINCREQKKINRWMKEDDDGIAGEKEEIIRHY